MAIPHDPDTQQLLADFHDRMTAMTEFYQLVTMSAARRSASVSLS